MSPIILLFFIQLALVASKPQDPTPSSTLELTEALKAWDQLNAARRPPPNEHLYCEDNPRLLKVNPDACKIFFDAGWCGDAGRARLVKEMCPDTCGICTADHRYPPNIQYF